MSLCLFQCVCKERGQAGNHGFVSSDERTSRVDVILVNTLVVMCSFVLGKSLFSFSSAPLPGTHQLKHSHTSTHMQLS